MFPASWTLPRQARLPLEAFNRRVLHRAVPLRGFPVTPPVSNSEAEETTKGARGGSFPRGLRQESGMRIHAFRVFRNVLISIL